MASVYKRTWTGQDGKERVRWVAAYKDQHGRRHRDRSAEIGRRRPHDPNLALAGGEFRVVVIETAEPVAVPIVGHLDRAVPQQCLQSLWRKPHSNAPGCEEMA